MCSTQVQASKESIAKLQRSFLHRDGSWYIEVDQQLVGPFTDKADAQMALMYYKMRTCWPNAKQLREYARNGI